MGPLKWATSQANSYPIEYMWDLTIHPYSHSFSLAHRPCLHPNRCRILHMLDEHDSPQWYDIVHFEHKLSWLCFGLPKNASYQWREYYLIIINPRSFHKLADVGLSSSNNAHSHDLLNDMSFTHMNEIPPNSLSTHYILNTCTSITFIT